jgi:hypothetical protein
MQGHIAKKLLGNALQALFTLSGEALAGQKQVDNSCPANYYLELANFGEPFQQVIPI